MPETSEKSFETVIEAHLLANGYTAVDREGFDRERARRVGGGGELEPFCQVAVWWLEQRLARMPA